MELGHDRIDAIAVLRRREGVTRARWIPWLLAGGVAGCVATGNNRGRDGGSSTCAGYDEAGTCIPFGPTDEPDPYFADTNGDGVDGDASKAVFVAPSGDDTTGDGTREHPLATIGAAIRMAQAQRRSDVLAAGGEYAESVTLPAGIQLFGGYAASNGWRRSRDVATVIRGGSTALTVSMGGATTHVDLVTVRAAAADPARAGSSSIGVFVKEGSGTLSMWATHLEAGNGAPGQGGLGGRGGDGGQSGQPGRDGVSSMLTNPGPPAGQPGVAGQSVCARAGGDGGQGGYLGHTPAGRGAGDGEPGRAAMGGATAGTGGGASGACRQLAETGTDGRAGAAGMAGTPGIASMAFGTVDSDGYTPPIGGTGTGGTAGWGGGGGGGGGGAPAIGLCIPDTGGGGGGGGAGGCAGEPGSGGSGGGGSFGIVNGAGRVTLSLTDCDVMTATGGVGGAGGAGGSGGEGGVGGAGGHSADDAAGGGAGGAGGRGGSGGGGGGAAGGPSVGVATRGPLMASNVRYTLGQAGAGGAGGASNGAAAAPAGPAGVRAEVRDGL